MNIIYIETQMKMFIYNILIIVFLFLVIYQVYLEVNNSYSYINIIEGMESSPLVYKDYGSTDSGSNALILSQQNAGNIDYLKQHMNEQENKITDLTKKVDTLSGQVNTMSGQLNGLAQQQAVYATELVGSKPAEITGTN
jgi:hypothetical protein